MTLLIGFLTFILVVNCLFLMLLVLVQLPKKEAGAGLAFGAGAVDTLIGAGSGNALTKLTKYAGASFLGLAVVLAMLNAQRHQGTSRTLQEELARKSAAAPMLATPPATAPATGQLSNNAASAAPAAATTASPSDQATTAAPSAAPTVQLTLPAASNAAPAEAK